MSDPLPAGATIGILGGGQLGRMLSVAAARLGYKTHIFEPGAAPAADVSAASTHAAYEDTEALEAFAHGVDVVTFEFENVPAEALENGGIAICAPIAPYATTRRAVREDIEEYGAFVEVHVATSIEECERRDRKGLYKLAREGKIKEFTGISDPYDVPQNPELSLDTETVDVDYCAQQVLLKLESMGLIAG